MNVTDGFYLSLPHTERFERLADISVYRPLPQDWIVGVADIRNSTAAIEQGKYREVNALAVALITAVINACKPISIPYVFGGDGVSFCIPQKFQHSVSHALAGARKLAKESFQLDLRAGLIPQLPILSAEKKVLVGKYQSSAPCFQAAFAGGGMQLAEELLKKNPELFHIPPQEGPADFSGFECRWAPFKSPKGETASVVVKALNGQDLMGIYRGVLRDLEDCYGAIEDWHPLRESGMKMALNAGKLETEARIRSFGKGAVGCFTYGLLQRIQSAVGLISIKFNIRFGQIEWGNYKRQAILNSDVRKFNDGLQFVVSGNSKQHEAFAARLESRRAIGEIAYGLHRSDSAIMTCYVADYAAEHYHFVDGSDGGYSRAAQMLKSQMERNKGNA